MIEAQKKFEKDFARIAKADGMELTPEIWYMIGDYPWLAFCSDIPAGRSVTEVVLDRRYDAVYAFLLRKTYEAMKERIGKLLMEAAERAKKKKEQMKTFGQQEQERWKEEKRRKGKRGGAEGADGGGGAEAKDDDPNKDDNKDDTGGGDDGGQTGGNETDADGIESADEAEAENDDKQQLIFDIIDDGRESMGKRFRQTMGNLYKQLSSAMAKGFNSLRAGLGRVGGMLKSGFQKAKDNLVMVLLALFLFFRTNFLSKIVDGFKAAFPNLSEKIGGIVDSLAKTFEEVKEWFEKTDWKEALDDLKNNVLDMWEWLKSWFGETEGEKVEKKFEEYSSVLRNDIGSGAGIHWRNAYSRLGVDRIQLAQMSLDDIKGLDGWKSLDEKERGAIELMKSTDYTSFLSREEQKAYKRFDPQADLNKIAEMKFARIEGGDMKTMSVEGVALEMDNARQMGIVQHQIDSVLANLSDEEFAKLQNEADGRSIDAVLADRFKIATEGYAVNGWTGGENLLDKSGEYLKQKIEERRLTIEAQRPQTQPTGGSVVTNYNTNVTNMRVVEGRSERVE